MFDSDDVDDGDNAMEHILQEFVETLIYFILVVYGMIQAVIAHVHHQTQTQINTPQFDWSTTRRIMIQLGK